MGNSEAGNTINNDHAEAAYQALVDQGLDREAAHLRSIQKQELNPILLFERKVAGQLTAAPERPLLGDAVAENEPQILKEFVEVVLDLRRKYEALLATTRQGD